MALTKVTNSMIYGAVVNVFDFMTPAQIADVQARTKTLDVTSAINAALASLGGLGGTVRMPKGLYRTTSEIILPGAVTLCGDGVFGGTGAYDQGATTIYGDHNGNSILNLAGSGACRIQDLCLQAGPPSGVFPQTGLLLGRTTSASSGYHHIARISVYGCYDAAAIMAIASEDNYWEDIYVWIYGGAAKYCLYTGIGNSSNFPGMTQPFVTSSNLTNTFNRFWFTNSSFNTDSAIIYIDGAEGVGSWSFYGGYMTASSGSYVEIANGFVDGLSMIGPLTFVGCSGERLQDGDPLYGFKLTASLGVTLPNLNIVGGRYDLLAGTDHYLFFQSNNLTLVQPNITMKPPEAFPYAQVLLRRGLIFGGTINLGRYAAWQTATLTNGWVTSFGAPYPAPSYMIDSTGRVHFRGTITAGSGPIMTLPVDYRPAYLWRIPTQSNGAPALLSVNSSGVVDILSGSATDLELAGVSFDMTAWVQP
jgi:hypothetical protein